MPNLFLFVGFRITDLIKTDIANDVIFYKMKQMGNTDFHHHKTKQH